MKRPYLAVHDYGTGGLWAYIWAESADVIEARFDAKVVLDLPEWMIGEKVVTLDADNDASEWLPRR